MLGKYWHTCLQAHGKVRICSVLQLWEQQVAVHQVTACVGTGGSFSQPVTPPGEATENTIFRESFFRDISSEILNSSAVWFLTGQNLFCSTAQLNLILYPAMPFLCLINNFGDAYSSICWELNFLFIFIVKYEIYIHRKNTLQILKEISPFEIGEFRLSLCMTVTGRETQESLVVTAGIEHPQSTALALCDELPSQPSWARQKTLPFKGWD